MLGTIGLDKSINFVLEKHLPETHGSFVTKIYCMNFDKSAKKYSSAEQLGEESYLVRLYLSLNISLT